VRRSFEEHYSDYCKEQWGREIIKEAYGFVSYDINQGSVYIADMYIEPHLRHSGLGKRLEAQVIAIAIEAKRRFLTCKIHRSDTDWRINFKIYTEHCGYVMLSENQDSIHLIKEIGGDNE
jgi:GNAT superfamily N-acetyltransferase